MIVKRELTRCSIEDRPASTVSISYDDLTGAIASVEVLAQVERVRMIVTHLLQPLLNATVIFTPGLLTVFAVPAGYTFSPTTGKASGGKLPNAEISIFWEAV